MDITTNDDDFDVQGVSENMQQILTSTKLTFKPGQIKLYIKLKNITIQFR